MENRGPYQVLFQPLTSYDFAWLGPEIQDPDYNFFIQFPYSDWVKVQFITPDGATHELRPVSHTPYHQARDFLWGYYWETPDKLGNPINYYSSDGSFIWARLYPSTNALRWEAYMPDGTRVFVKNGFQRIEDTNGNTIKIVTEPDPVTGNLTTYYRDENAAGAVREIRQFYNPQTNTQQVQYQPVGGASWVTIDIVWGQTSVQGQTYNVLDHFENQVCSRVARFDPVNMEEVREIVLPPTEPGQPQERFSFSYNSDSTESVAGLTWQADCQSLGNPIAIGTSSRGWGSLGRMTTPSGAEVNYTYGLDNVHWLLEPNEAPREKIRTKTVIHDGVNDTWLYFTTSPEGTVIGPDGSRIVESMYETEPAYSATYGGPDGLGGLVYKTVNYLNGQPSTTVEKHWKRLLFDGGADIQPGTLNKSVFNAVVDAEYTTLHNAAGAPAKMSARTFRYDHNGNLLEERDYDWFLPTEVARQPENKFLPVGVPASATLLRVTRNSYHSQAEEPDSPDVYAKRLPVSGAPPSPFILNAVKETTAGNGTVVLSKTRLHYDEQGFNALPVRGNVTKERRDNGGVWIDVDHAYDSLGNRISTRDPKHNITKFFYEDQTKAQPTSIVVDPDDQVQGDEHTTQIVYDYYTGLVRSQTDPNGALTETGYTNQLLGTVDPYGRPGVVIGPAVTSTVNGQQFVGHRRKVITRYTDHLNQVETISDLNQEGDGLLNSRTTADALGRVTITEASEDGTANYTIRSRNDFERMGRITYGSNPTRDNGATTDGWTRTTRDDLGRVVEVATFNGPARPAATATNWNGRVQTGYDLEQTTVTDQAGKKRKSVVDGLGRLAKVYEDPEASNLETSYTYDALGNLTKVNQGIQERQFTYDGLSRLRTAKNPEQVNGASQMVATVYTYDPASNLETRTNPNGTTVGFTYDGLNRVKTKTLSVGGTFTFAYDTAVNGKGRLRSVTSAGGDGNYYDGYDKAGRVTASRQVTTTQQGQQGYQMSYGYNLAGAMTTETYPSGKEYRTGYDNAGRVSLVSRHLSGVLDRTYASGFSYTAHGAVSSMGLSYISGSPRMTEQTSYNSRLQPTRMEMRKAGTNELLLGLDNGYGTTANNGNMQTQGIRIGGGGGTATWMIQQSFTYDGLNRLDVASEAASWTQDNDYDRYGNRWVSSGLIVPGNEALTPQSQQAFVAATNLLSASLHDFSGNQTRDGAGRSFTYDAENRQLTFNGSAATYVYDGEGHRVKKTDATGTTTFVYNAGGQLVAEYTSGGAPPNGTSYLTTDHLGSTRLVTDATGSVKSRRDYLPFGEEVPASQGVRSSVSGYGAAEATRQRFTSKERDNESGLDYFLARYYSSAQGRFTSPDEFTDGPDELFDFTDHASSNPTFYADLTEPQTLNKYQYGLNSPLKYVDPDGHQKTSSLKEQLKQSLAALWEKYGPKSDSEEKKPEHNPYSTGVPLPSKGELVERAFQTTGEQLDLAADGIALFDRTGISSFAGTVLRQQYGQADNIDVALSGFSLVFGSKQSAQALKIVKQAGTHASLELSGAVRKTIQYIPTRQEAEKLIAAAGGRIDRIEKAHKGAGHAYPHINYTINKQKATIRVQSVQKRFIRDLDNAKYKKRN